jgi:hypothetical protein
LSGIVSTMAASIGTAMGPFQERSSVGRFLVKRS